MTEPDDKTLPAAAPKGPRRFLLVRDTDISGVSGEGVVAEGVLWSDGWAVTHWLGPHGSTVSWHKTGMCSPHFVHSHGGATRFVWLDGPGQCDHRFTSFVAADREWKPREHVCVKQIGHDTDGGTAEERLHGDGESWTWTG